MMNWQSPRWTVWLSLAVALVAGCGGKKGTLTVGLVLPVGMDPFATAAKVHVTAGEPPFADQTSAVSGGHFSLDIAFKPPSSGIDTGAVRVEGIAGDGTIVARGKTLALGIQPMDESVNVLVGPVGKLAILPSPLQKARFGFAVANIPRLGPAFVGGRSDANTPSADVEVLQLYDVAMRTGTSLPAPRAGAVAFGVDRADQSTGLLLIAGGTDTGTLDAFDPLVGIGQWQTVATDPSLKRDGATATTLSDGTVLLSGGTSNNAALDTAALIATVGTVAVTSLDAKMVTARSGHTATPAHLMAGDGALIFGGNGSGPAAEAYVSAMRSFVAVPLSMDVPTRLQHAAVKRSSGEVLIIGGHAPNEAPLASVLQIDPVSFKVTTLDLLSTPRSGATATLIGDAILVCGGFGNDGMPIASCDVIDERLLARRGTLMLAAARALHTAIVTETGVLVIAGGVDGAGHPVGTVEFFTP